MHRYIIDRSLLEENIEKILARASVPVIAVIKADGYGFGLAQMTDILKAHGLRMFAVTEIEDLPVLRGRLDAEDDVLVMRSTALEDELSAIAEAGCIATIGSPRALEAAVRVAGRHGAPLRCHVKVDTGFSRYGFTPDEIDGILACYKADALQVEGIYTHLSSAFADTVLTKAQVGRLCDVARRIEAAGFDPGMRHAANSPAFYNVEGCQLDAVRIGSAFTGRLITQKATGLNRIGYLEARVIDVRTLSASARWGYGGRVQVKRDTQVAFVSAGTREGFGVSVESPATMHKALSAAKGALKNRRQTVLIEGRSYPVLAEADLSMTMVDVTGADVKPGDVAIMDPNPLMVGPHVPRVYL